MAEVEICLERLKQSEILDEISVLNIQILKRQQNPYFCITQCLDVILKEGVEESVLQKVLSFGDSLGESVKLESVIWLWVFSKVLFDKDLNIRILLQVMIEKYGS